MERLQAEQEKGCEIKYLNMGERISLHEIYACFFLVMLVDGNFSLLRGFTLIPFCEFQSEF